jgi:hypothetical protein
LKIPGSEWIKAFKTFFLFSFILFFVAANELLIYRLVFILCIIETIDTRTSAFSFFSSV